MRKSARHARLQLLLTVAAASMTAGCVSSVVVESDFPTPLIEAMPVRVGVIIDNSLSDYVYVEDIPQQSTWTIDLGDANVAMFRPLLRAMFKEVEVVDNVPLPPDQAPLFDGVIKPALDKFEFDVPVGERDEFVEVWMQYRLTLYDPNGDVVVEWPVSGYGKAELDGGREKVLQRAAIVAMREVGANIATQFPQQEEVGYWLTERENAAALSVQNQPDN